MPIGVFKREFQTFADINQIKKNLPEKISEIMADGVEQNLITRPSQLHYYILNLNAQ